MFISQLNYLIALDEHRHFGRAAESCHVSQPALSNGIRELSANIGVIPTASQAAMLLSKEYREILPQLTLEVMSLSTPEILQRLRSQNLHLGVLYDRSVAGESYDVLPRSSRSATS